jgi:hypothetical protein
MKEIKRKHPMFSLCGLNCGLCPRFHTDGASKCPGCGGKDFHLTHPACAVMTCNAKHNNVEFCFQCSLYPCKKYTSPEKKDSFISYKHVLEDFGKARDDLDGYLRELDYKVSLLKKLIEKYNDGKRKNYYCVCVNLLRIDDLKIIEKTIDDEIADIEANLKTKIERIIKLFEEFAEKDNIELKLRK